jgi:hypothetical protein
MKSNMVEVVNAEKRKKVYSSINELRDEMLAVVRGEIPAFEGATKFYEDLIETFAKHGFDVDVDYVRTLVHLCNHGVRVHKNEKAGSMTDSELAEFRAGVERGLAQAAAGDVVSGDAVAEWVKSWGTENELPRPTNSYGDPS